MDMPSTSAGPSLSAPQAQLMAQPQTQPQKAQLQSYTAYEKNGLKITLTPKTAPSPNGQQTMVQILARFTASETVEGVGFQVAVPRVSPCTYHIIGRLLCGPA